MMNRMIGVLALGGVLLSSTAFAENCKNIVLYENGTNKGHMDEATSLFPEAPEWSTNWGDFGNMKSPYIRLSGMRNYKSDWTGSFVFDELPKVVRGGSLKLKARTTQYGNLGVWLSGAQGNGKIVMHSIDAGNNLELEIPISSLVEGDFFEVDKIGIGLFNVPANQYTTLFIDDIELTCVESISQNSSSSENSVIDVSLDNSPYSFVEVDVASPNRVGLFEDEMEKKFTSHFSKKEQDSLQKITALNFVVTLEKYLQMMNEFDKDSINPIGSSMNWYNILFMLEKGTIRENTIPNSKKLYDEALELAAISDNSIIPILFADVNFAVSYCEDSTCSVTKLEDSGITFTGIPVASVNGSKIRFVYDPYFSISPSGKLPNLDICTGLQCIELKPKSEGLLEFESAGVQKVIVKIHSDRGIVEQEHYVEVK